MSRNNKILRICRKRRYGFKLHSHSQREYLLIRIDIKWVMKLEILKILYCAFFILQITIIIGILSNIAGNIKRIADLLDFDKSMYSRGYTDGEIAGYDKATKKGD